MTTTESVIPKQELPGDQHFNKYLKTFKEDGTQKSLYAYINDVCGMDMFKATRNEVLPDGGNFELDGFWWERKGGILFKKTKSEHEAWSLNAGKFKKTGTWDTRKITEITSVIVDVAGFHWDSVNAELKKGYELFGKDFHSSVVVMKDSLIVGLVKKE
jgi:hypothetical protein